MKKISYEFLTLELEKLWSKEFSSEDTIGINEHCDFIISFVESCGWTTEEYISRMMGYYIPGN